MCCTTYWKSAIKTPEHVKWRRLDIFMVNSVQIQYNIQHIGQSFLIENKEYLLLRLASSPSS